MGADGSVWIAGADGSVQRWNEAQWCFELTNGEATTQITVDQNGTPWANQSNGAIWTAQ